jgi:imidazoleglycerol-phosphate dehydratase
MRKSEINRKTAETDITLKLDIDGMGENKIDTGCGFLDHMLTLFSRHGGFDLELKCIGDTNVDYHHTVEDIGIVLGKALNEALGEMRGIKRYGSFILPMDESLILSAVDISGRSYLGFKLNIPTQRVGDFDTELVREFFEAFVRNANITLHLSQLEGYNSHHIIEGAFKSVARSLKEAVAIEERFKNQIPSTKGVL